MKIHCLILCFLIRVFCAAQGQIEGYVVDETTKKPLVHTSISLWIMDSIRHNSIPKDKADPSVFSPFGRPNLIDTFYKRVQRVISDSTGYFLFKSLEPNIYEVSAFHVIGQRFGHNYGEFAKLPAVYVDCDSKIKQTIQLHVFCEYDLTKDLTHCPKCKKKDKILIIRHGLYPPGSEEEPGYYYTGYCTVENCSATKRCMRCKYEF